MSNWFDSFSDGTREYEDESRIPEPHEVCPVCEFVGCICVELGEKHLREAIGYIQRKHDPMERPDSEWEAIEELDHCIALIRGAK